uniref:Uncharacterized protein n=1 Tax=Panagrolaimus sp. ES5 TaxID=591445 RepID=A0AC34FUQ6_9BILA
MEKITQKNCFGFEIQKQFDLTKTEETRLAVAQRRMERRLLNVRLIDRHSREWLRERTQLKDIVHAARQRKWNYIRKLMTLPDNRWNRKLTE